MDKLQWFKFTPSDWIMGKIQRCEEVTQARFIRLCCVYWNKYCIMSYDDAEIEIDKNHLDILINKKIIKNKNGNIDIFFLLEQFKKIEIDKLDKSQSGQIGNLKRWNRVFYDKFIKGELTLKEAIEQSKSSPPDRHPIATQSQIIAEKSRGEKKREDKRREEDIINNSLLSEIKISDDEKFISVNDLKMEIDSAYLEQLKITQAFQKLFIKNLKEKNSPTSHQEKVKLGSAINPIRLMIEKKEATKAQITEAYKYLSSPEGEFWKANILSTSKLREKLPTLLAKKNTKSEVDAKKEASAPNPNKRKRF